MAQPSGNYHGTGDFEFKTFLLDIPPVTRTLFLTMFTGTLLSFIGILPIKLFLLEWASIFGKFEIWRLVLTFCHAGKVGLGFLIRMYFLYFYSKQLENGTFFGRTANYAWFLTIVAFFVFVSSPIFPTPVNGGAFVTAIIHLWGRHAGNLNVTLYGFIQIPAKYFSLVLVGLDLVLTGGLSTADVLGLFGGHLYYFLDSVYPAMPSGKQLIFVPNWFEGFIDQATRFLGSTTGLQRGPPVAPPSGGTRSSFGGTSGVVSGSSRSTTARSGSTDVRAGVNNPSIRARHAWGTGRALGSE